MLTKSSTL